MPSTRLPSNARAVLKQLSKAGDHVAMALLNLLDRFPYTTYTNATLPDPTQYLPGSMIWNAQTSKALWSTGSAWVGVDIDPSAIVLTTGNQTIAGIKTFSSVPRSSGLRSTATDAGISFYHNVVDLGGTGGYETPVGFSIIHEQPLNATGSDFSILVPSKAVGSGHPYARTFGVIHIGDYPCIEWNDAYENYLAAIATRWDAGSPVMEFRQARKIVPEYNADDSAGASPVYNGHHYGTVLGSNAWPGELDGPRMWRSVGSFVFDTATAVLATSGAITWQPVRTGEVGYIASTGNVTGITISPPDDGTGRTIDGVNVTLILKQGNASHTWPSTITNLLKPAGVSVKATTTLNGVDVLTARYCTALGKYVLTGTQTNLV